ncbi:MAG TPA: 1,2-phenylacetyl-CoA epoxidase subunit PaaE [Longimicrobiales bacterium]|nr:1,2-phenylacetyl-CoA epoxidase subunit PaaE [Longimicrobiales bacterium]
MTGARVTAGVRFYPLRVASVDRLTEEAVAITFDVPDHLAEEFRYLPGQHVTVRADVDGQDVRRSYSLCANANTGRLRVGVKRLRGGAFSTWATTRLREGATLEVTPPAGEFTIEADPGAANHYAAVAAGSGITPVLSLISTTLELEPNSRWTLIFGNRGASSIMFLDEVEGLKDDYPDRLHLIHVLSRERPELELFAGRIDASKLERLFATVVDADTVDQWYLCGPYEMVETARKVIEGRGVSPEGVHDELFFAGPIDPASIPPPDRIVGSVSLGVKVGGRRSETRMEPDMSILDAALRVRSELPFSCKGGMCASCKARLTEGEVSMDRNYALVDSELEAGYILTCQSHPAGDRVAVDYDI